MTKVQGIHDQSPGQIHAFGGATAPFGWVICDGKEYSQVDYPRLYAAIGTAYGTSNAALYFRVPDLRGSFARGSIGTMGGTVTSTTSTTATFSVVHNFNRSGIPVQVPANNIYLTANTTYWIIYVDTYSIQFASSLANAMAGTHVPLTTHSSASVLVSQWLDPDYSSRGSVPGGASNKTLPGSYQIPAVARPNSSFVLGTETTPHNHLIDLHDQNGGWNNGVGPYIQGATTMKYGAQNTYTGFPHTTNETAGHTHNITSGGDNDTRPNNATVNYIIKT